MTFKELGFEASSAVSGSLLWQEKLQSEDQCPNAGTIIMLYSLRFLCIITTQVTWSPFQAPVLKVPISVRLSGLGFRVYGFRV